MKIYKEGGCCLITTYNRKTTLANYDPKQAKKVEEYFHNNCEYIKKIRNYMRRPHFASLKHDDQVPCICILYHFYILILLHPQFNLTIEQAQTIAKNMTKAAVEQECPFFFPAYYMGKAIGTPFNVPFFTYKPATILEKLKVPKELEFIFKRSARTKDTRNITRDIERDARRQILAYFIITKMIEGKTMQQTAEEVSFIQKTDRHKVGKIWKEYAEEKEGKRGKGYHYKFIVSEFDPAHENNKKQVSQRRKNQKKEEKKKTKEANAMKLKPETLQAKIKRNESIVKDFESGMNLPQLCEKYSLDISTISRKVAEAGTTAKEKQAAALAMRLVEVARLAAQGMTQRDIANFLGVSVGTVNSDLQRLKRLKEVETL